MPFAAAIAGNRNKHNAIPAGQELTKIAMAVAISLPANQSVTIFDINTLSMTPPMPAPTRPAICQCHVGANAMRRPPAIIRIRPKRTTRLSPKRRPISPPGNAKAIPGARYRLMSKPMSPRPTPYVAMMAGDKEAADWNWKAMLDRTMKRIVRTDQRCVTMQRLQLSRVRAYAIFGIAPRSDDWFGSFASDHSQRPRGINIRFTPQATELLSCR